MAAIALAIGDASCSVSRKHIVSNRYTDRQLQKFGRGMPTKRNRYPPSELLQPREIVTQIRLLPEENGKEGQDTVVSLIYDRWEKNSPVGGIICVRVDSTSSGEIHVLRSSSFAPFCVYDTLDDYRFSSISVHAWCR